MSRGYLSDDDDQGATEIHDARRVRETAKAVLFEIDGEEIWIPKSVIRGEDRAAQTVSVPEWFARKEGIA